MARIINKLEWYISSEPGLPLEVIYLRIHAMKQSVMGTLS